MNHKKAQLDHPNLVTYLKVEADSGVIRIITEQNNLSFDDIPIRDDNQIRMILRFVLDVMKYLHSNNVYNINLKTENILLDENGIFVLWDYLGNFYFEYFEDGN